jgi:hypothetical protein
MNTPGNIILDTERLFRAIRRRELVWNPARQRVEVSYAAFQRRCNPLDEDGLSVDRALYRTPQDCIRTFQALVRLTAVEVRAIADLDVQVKPLAPSGANITGLPWPPALGFDDTDPEKQRCEDLAAALRDRAEFEIHPTPHECDKRRAFYESKQV